MRNDDDIFQSTRRGVIIGTAALAGAAGIGIMLSSAPASATPASMRAAIRTVAGDAQPKKGRI